MYKLKNVALIFYLLIAANLSAGTIKVSTAEQLRFAVASAIAGDKIICTKGVYTLTESINIKCTGTASQPIVILSEKIGETEINGTGGFILDSLAAYIVINGFKFTHSTGITIINVGATHCTFAHNIFECAPAGKGNKPYLTVSGDENEICYNTFRNKNTEGCMVTVQGPGTSGMAQRTWIHHNYFYNFESTANNCSAIQIGLSRRSLSSAYSIVEYNLFIKTRGENEGCICNKSCNNIYRYNTFGEGSTELSLRHGNFCEVYNNYFIGCTGLRFSGDDHKIYNNYFANCTFAICCTNGDGIVPRDKLTSHDQAERVKIIFNTMINNRQNYGMPKRNKGLGAKDIVFANNLIQGGIFTIADPYVNPTWQSNIIWSAETGINQLPESGFKQVNPQLEKEADGIYHIKSSSQAVNNSAGSYPEIVNDIDGQLRDSKTDIGADEYSNSDITNKPVNVEDVGAFAKSGTIR